MSATHGHSVGGLPSRTYSKWRSMITRCTNQNRPDFKNYGAKGITVCERWLKFENFLADMGPAPVDLTLDRIDGKKGYSPENCRWATRQQQNVNRACVRMLTFNGKTQCLQAWADDLGYKHRAVLSERLRNGWTLEDAFSIPNMGKSRKNAKYRHRTHCAQGHSFEKYGTRRGDGYLTCRECARIRDTKRRALQSTSLTHEKQS